MIKNITNRIAVDRRGKITSGVKAISRTGAEYPKAVDYFVIDDFPELIRSYGEKPTKLVLFFPSDTITDFFDCNYVLYGKNNEKIRSCDGEDCTHRIPETIAGQSFEAGEISPCLCFGEQAITDDKFKPCKYSFYLRAYVADIKLNRVNNPTCYMFHSGSKNSGENIYSELDKIKSLNMGVLRGVRFDITVDMVSSKADAKKKFPIWNLHAFGMLDEIRERTQFQLDISTKEVKAIAQSNGKKKEIDNSHVNKIAEEVLTKDELKGESNKKQLNQEAIDMFTPEDEETPLPWDKPIKKDNDND